MEMEIRLFRGEWVSEHPDQVHLSRFPKVQQAQEDQQVAQMKKVQAELDQIAKALVKAQEKLKTLRNLTSSMAVTAQEQISRNSAKFGWQQLSKKATQRVLALQNRLRICSKCRLPRLRG